jgi:gamma-glutamyltranspeptidase/glutathione hydrolase
LLALMGLLLSLLTGCAGPSDLAPSPALPTACESPTGTRSVVVGLGRPGDPAQPGHSSGHWLGIKPVLSKNGGGGHGQPAGQQSGLRSGESGRFLADAAKAAHMVWGLVEPQPSGIGGGAFVVHHNATAKKVQTCDERETAPAAATENKQRWVLPPTKPRPCHGAQTPSIKRAAASAR